MKLEDSSTVSTMYFNFKSFYDKKMYDNQIRNRF